MGNALRTRVSRLEKVIPAAGRWVEPRLRHPDGPAFVWDPDPDRRRQIVIPFRDERYTDDD